MTVTTPPPGRVRSVNVGQARRKRSGRGWTGIEKLPVQEITVHDPGVRGGAGRGGGASGVEGDFIGNLRHHGGTDQAVYLVATEELEFWAGELERELPPGSFGENVTTRGTDVDALPLGTRLRLGTALLETRGPRIPCDTFSQHLHLRGWAKRFTAHGRSGVYCAVLTPGTIRPGDPVLVDELPDHGIDTATAFRAWSGDLEAAARVLASGAQSPARQAELAARVSARTRD